MDVERQIQYACLSRASGWIRVNRHLVLGSAQLGRAGKRAGFAYYFGRE